MVEESVGTQDANDPSGRHSPLEVLRVSLRLGLTSFGGPIAHLGYFEHTYVRTRRWLTEHEYAELLALCQIIPGPASSQLGFLIGLHRAGYWGALAAWFGFTLPSAVLLFVAVGAAARLHGVIAQAAFHGLKLVAVAVVAQAVWSLGHRLWTDRLTVGIGILTSSLVLAWGAPGASLGALGVGALLGAIMCRARIAPAVSAHSAVSRRVAWVAGGVFIALLGGLPVLAFRSPHGAVALADTFYRAGALVFGGGHVVLPLLRDALVPSGWLSEDSFLAGYGLAQAVPGPLFTVAAYLGAANAYVGPSLWAAVIAVVSIFLPGMLLALAAVALLKEFAAHERFRGALIGVNAAVVGILGVALYNPVLTTSVHSIVDGLIVVAGVVLLERCKVPPLLVVVLCLAGSFTEVWLI